MRRIWHRVFGHPKGVYGWIASDLLRRTCGCGKVVWDRYEGWRV